MFDEGSAGGVVGPSAPGTNPWSSGCPLKPTVIDISPIATTERIEENLGMGGPGESFDEGGLPPIHGLVGGGEEA